MRLSFEKDAGNGPRGRLGLIVLQADETMENEFRQFFPDPSVALYHSRVASAPEVTEETLRRMEADIPRAVRLLPPVAFDVIGYGCTSGATVIGPARVAEIVRAERPGVAVTDPISALLARLQALGAGRIGFLTPYVPSVSARMRALLEENGVSIAAFGSFEEASEHAVACITPESVMAGLAAIDTPDCEALFVSCTNLRFAGKLAEAAARFGKPVITSNSALAWHMAELAAGGCPISMPVGD